MAKTIKFNLVCDGNPIRTIEDLQNNFSVEDVLSYYNNKLLHRWLEVRGYSDELKQVSAITGEKPMQIVKELIKIFQVAADEKKIEESIYILGYFEERKELYSLYEKENFKVKSIIDDYETGYRELVNGILDNPNDIAKIKANLSEMVLNYKWILQLNHRDLFYDLLEKSNLAIMCMLMNGQIRNYYLPVEKEGKDGEVTLDINSNKSKAAMFNKICTTIKKIDFRGKLGNNLKSFSGVTDGYWKDIETKEKKYMIIEMADGDFVRSAGKSGGDLSHSDVLNAFRIVEGIDYKSNSSSHTLWYMEV